MLLSIITINFRTSAQTISCVDSVYATYTKQFEKNEYELLIVDNFSEDDSVDVIKKELAKRKYKNVKLLENTKNNGFGAGNNFGAEKAVGKYLLFLNNDTLVKSGIDSMVAFLEKSPKIGILGGPLKNTNGSQQSSSGKFYTLSRVFLLLLGLQRFGMDKNPKKALAVDWVKGALLMIEKSLFEKVHGFDEGIFMYTEDIELCYRVHKIGREVWFYPDVDIVHKDQGSSNRTFAIVHIYEGILYFYKKHKSPGEFALVKLLLQLKAYLLISLGKFTKNSYLVSAYEKALSVC